ncbi:MAG: CPBP family intramembrane metalloprotease [Clostridia bacterium]|nr:CPBP family intramembrane metalloprotease [Clostridia bacterium]
MLSRRKPNIHVGIAIVLAVIYVSMSEFISVTVGRGVPGSLILDLSMAAICAAAYFHEFGLRERDYRLEHVGILYCAGFVYWLCVCPLVSYYQREAGQWPVDILGGLSGTDRPMYAIIALVAAPLFEELFFRGILFECLQERIPWPFASLIASAVFAAIHGSNAQVYGAFILGLFLCMLYHVTGNIGWNVLFHSLYNLGMLFVQPMLPVPESMETHHVLFIIVSAVLLLYTTVLFWAVVHINESGRP